MRFNVILCDFPQFYQNNKEKLHKEACKRHQNLSEEDKNKSNNIAVNDMRISLKMKSKS